MLNRGWLWQLDPETLEAANGRFSTVVDNNAIRLKPDQFPTGVDNLSSPFRRSIVEISRITGGIGIPRAKTMLQRPRIAACYQVPLRAASPQIDPPISIVTINRAGILDRNAVAKLGTSDTFSDISIANARLGQPFAIAIKLEVVALGMLVVILPLTRPVHAGDTILLLPWLGSWPFNLAGLLLALTIVCKAAAVALLMEPMLATASLTRTLQGFTDLGLPPSLNQMVLLCHRYIFVVQEEMQRMQRSMRVRGFAPRTNLATLRTLGNGLGMLFIRSFERTERVYEAMLSRGYQGAFPGQTRQKITSRDLVKGAFFIMIGLLLLVGDRLLPLTRF
ncbi:MAG: energy-coupling factor transporter transmembrane protein EcfT [Chloroflexia bacterium]|nr:energy-coupling factor transporter transmembrane protein EcfT [Chloroflexia bacterium]